MAREARPGAVERRVDRVHVDDAGAREDVRDVLVVEAPLEVRYRREPVVTIMRTPGDDLALVRGLLFSEGALGEGDDAGLAITDDNVVTTTASLERRAMLASSSCGVCGKTSIAQLELRAAAVTADVRAAPAVIAALPGRLRAAQSLFERTGGLHAAGAFDLAGGPIAVREDVGRHNAVDKLVGWGLEAGAVPFSDTILCVSGRTSFEIVQKAICAGFPIVAAVSAPSSLAVDLAERFRVTLCGFVRGGAFNVYSHASRIA